MDVTKDQDFDEWYNQVVEAADLCDKRYPVKGMNIWKPYGWEVARAIDALIREEMRRTGHQEVNFPLLVPESLFQKEADHIKGFGSEVFWVTHAGDHELDERLLLRPTSETALYTVFALWIRSHADLPLKTFQIVNTFRYETKMTKAFIRVREIHFFEAHTCHRDYEEAEGQVGEDVAIARSFFDTLCLPFLMHRRPDWDKFAGAHYSIGVDVLMPSLKVLQVASIHQYRENFSRPFGITYEDEEGNHHHVHQTTYGMSERVLGGIVGLHGDDRGIALPSAIAPIQVVIVPILFRGKEGPVEEACREVERALTESGLRVHLDSRDKTPGNKFYDWELRGVPARIEIGPRDVEKQAVTLVTRDGEKKQISRDHLGQIDDELAAFDRRIATRAQQFRDRHVHSLSSLEKREGIIRVPWCGQEECGLEMEEEADMSSLGIPYPEPTVEGTCAACGGKARHWLSLAKSY
ncbi:MAG: proline--tRNA ligase [Candidatus Thermoplasmatota archaeon]|nr:proline--tRNA ligase [Candidatus Thermoplasmatota archaeon]MDD5777986.1 proline--tRNA ligase [Candidatus Thermoplasmatota archaeon]